MTVKDQLKVLDRKIKQNKADYDLWRQNAEISALSSGGLDKYEYLTGKDLRYKPDPVQKAKFEYSPLGQVFDKGLKKREKQEGLLKRFKNIDDKTDNNLRAIEGPRTEDSNARSVFDRLRQQLTPEGIATFNRIIEERRLFNVYSRRSFTGSGRNKYFDFSHFIKIGDFLKIIYNGDAMIPDAEREQEGLEYEYTRLERYNPRMNGPYYSLKE